MVSTAHNPGIVWASVPGDYATFNSNHIRARQDRMVFVGSSASPAFYQDQSELFMVCFIAVTV